MAKVDVWMPIYIGDYLRDTQNLMAEEHGVYLLLLMYYWQKKGVIGSDLKRLAIVARSTQETTECILKMFFELVDGNYCNKRADKELKEAQIKSETARANVQKRWKKDTDVLPPYYHGNTNDDTESIRNGYSSPSPSPSHKEEEEYMGEKKSPSRFKPPTLEEVEQYCSERRNSVDPERFIDYNESKGWMVGKSKMKSWKAAIRTWEHNGFNSNEPKQSNVPEEREEPKPTPIPQEFIEAMKRQYARIEQA